MKREISRWLTAGALISVIALAATIPPAGRTFATSSHSVANAAHRCVATTGGAADATFTRNFNPFSPGYLDYTLGAIYEPLYVLTTAGGGRQYPWLATHYKWSKDAKTLFITIRRGVKWSDGQPFTARDVLFTFTAGKKNKVLDQIGYTAPDTNIARIYLASPDVVAIQLKKRDVTVLQNYLSNVKVIPEHIWSKVADPTKFTNPNPVGTGPFTQILRFGGQDYILGKNPHYWQKGKPMVPCVERVFSAGIDSATVETISGEVDWTHNFVADAQKVYVAKDPVHYHYFYATNSTPVGLFYDDTKYPWSLTVLREAVSMAIDRNRVYRIGEYGYEPPSGPIGIERIFPKWVDPKVEAAGKKYVTYDPAAAKAMLTKAGFKYQGTNLLDPKGTPVSLDMEVIAGWADWVLSAQIISKELQAIGIESSIKLDSNYNDWAGRADKTLVAHLHWTNGAGSTPYQYLDSNLGKDAYIPPGQDASTTLNWERFWDPTATKLLADWRKTPSAAQQHALANKLEAIMVKDFPYVPVMIGAIWYTYSTKYFTGWPTPKNYYAIGQFGAYPDTAVVLTRLKPA